MIALLLLLLGGCPPEQGYTEIVQRDFFQQSRRNAVDLLVVIDNSCSMAEEQENVARNFDTLIDIFGGADVDWRLGVTTTDVENEEFRGLLLGGDDEIILRAADGSELDRVTYDRHWGFLAGVSLALTGDKTAVTYNDTRLNWCASTAEYADGHLGTPGERNPSCSEEALPELEDLEDAGPRVPVASDLVISEILATSAGLDSRCEWFELTSNTADTLDLSGATVSDRGRHRGDAAAVVPDGTTIPPYGTLVVGRATSDNCGAPVDVAFPENLVLGDDIRVIDDETPDADERFAELIAQGTFGTGIEHGLEAARLVFSEEYADDNPPFLREEANLSILFVSDEDDLSPYPVDDYVRELVGLKGEEAFRDHSLVNLSAVVAKDPPAEPELPACTSANGFGWYGRRYLEAANLTQGLVESICAEDFAPIVERLGLTLSGLLLEFELSQLPQLETLKVSLYAGEDEESFVRELERDVDFTYVAEGNRLRFEEEQVPPSGHYVVAEYQVLPTGGTVAEGE